MPDKQTTIADAPKDGTWIEVHCIASGCWFRARWKSDFTSWNDDCSDLVVTGAWSDDDGWLQPNEVDAWRPCA